MEKIQNVDLGKFIIKILHYYYQWRIQNIRLGGEGRILKMYEISWNERKIFLKF